MNYRRRHHQIPADRRERCDVAGHMPSHVPIPGREEKRVRAWRRVRPVSSLDGARVRRPALASDDGPIFSTVAKLVEALKRSIPEVTQTAALKKEALRLGSELLRGTKYEGER
jgi:hypothetical protein